jgi:hypothetical protein
MHLRVDLSGSTALLKLGEVFAFENSRNGL